MELIPGDGSPELIEFVIGRSRYLTTYSELSASTA